MLIVAVLRAEDGWTYRAREVLDVVFAIECGNVRASKGASACKTKKIESSEIVGFAKRILVRWLIGYWKELGGNNLVAILQEVLAKTTRASIRYQNTHMTRKALQMVGIAQCSHELPRQMPLALPAYPLLPTRPPLVVLSLLRIITTRLSLPLRLFLGRVGIGTAIPLSCSTRLPIRQWRLLDWQRTRRVVVECPVSWTNGPFMRWETHQPGPPRAASKIMSTRTP